MKIYLDSIGCRLNQAEMDAVALRLAAAGHEIVDRAEAAERLILNTCAVTVEAERDARKRARHLHRKRPEAEIFLTGCYATLAPNVLAALPGVTQVVDNARKGHLIALIDPTADARPPDYELEPVMRARKAAGQGLTRAFVKVQDGCDKRCSFCVTTLARGEGRSRSMSAVVGEIRSLHAAGYREVVLTGVHLGSYGEDLGLEAGLTDLVRAILQGCDIPRVRLSSLEPWNITPELFALWGDPRLLPHLHLPLQAGCDRTLRRMARETTTDAFRRLAEQARSAIPDLNLTTDLITGFPGETEEDFMAGLDFVRELGFGRLHVFSYSQRPGTAAARMPDQVPMAFKKRRAAALIALGRQMTADYHARFVGREVTVLWERAKPGPEGGWRCRGYSDNYMPVQARGEQGWRNEVHRVRLETSSAGSLEGVSLAPSRRSVSTVNRVS